MTKAVKSTICWMLICVCLSACTTGIYSTNLEAGQDLAGEQVHFESAGYVVHSDEARAWIDALAEITTMSNIFIETKEGNVGLIHAYDEYAKSHPIVHIRFEKIPESQWMTSMDYAMYVGPGLISFLTFSVVPAYFPEPCVTRFQLDLPGESPQDLHTFTYKHRRNYVSWLPLFLFADFAATLDGGDMDTRWKVEEKRRLLRRFIREAAPKLAERESSITP